MARRLRSQTQLAPEGGGRPGAGRQDERVYQEQARQRLIEALQDRDEEGLDALCDEVEREQHKAQQGRPARTVDDIARRWLDAADPAWLVVAVALEAVALAGCVALFHATFGRRPHGLTLRRSAQIALGELAGFALVPTGAGGPAVRLWALRGGGMPWRTIGVRSVVYGVLFNIPYMVAALVLGLGVAVRALPGSAPTILALAPLALVTGALASIALIAATARSRWMSGTARWKRNTRAVLAVVPAGLRELRLFAQRPARAAGA